MISLLQTLGRKIPYDYEVETFLKLTKKSGQLRLPSNESSKKVLRLGGPSTDDASSFLRL